MPTITINGDYFEVDNEELTYEEIVAMAGESRYATVTYSTKRKPGSDVTRSGILYSGKTVIIEDDMRFSAVVTGNA